MNIEQFTRWSLLIFGIWYYQTDSIPGMYLVIIAWYVASVTRMAISNTFNWSAQGYRQIAVTSAIPDVELQSSELLPRVSLTKERPARSWWSATSLENSKWSSWLTRSDNQVRCTRSYAVVHLKMSSGRVSPAHEYYLLHFLAWDPRAWDSLLKILILVIAVTRHQVGLSKLFLTWFLEVVPTGELRWAFQVVF